MAVNLGANLQKNAVRLGLFERTSLSLQLENTEVVAQSVRASDCGSEGRGFEPRLPPFFKQEIPVHCAGISCLKKPNISSLLSVEIDMYSIPDQLRSPIGQRIIFIVLPLMHLAGFIGLQWPPAQLLFKALVPFHLLTTLALLLLFHTDWNKSAILFCTVAYLVGFSIEALGVHTGVIFGQYRYGVTLGWKVIDIPLVIGANWLTLIYSAGIVANHWHRSSMVKALLAAWVVVGLDVLIEPVAIRLDFWQWAGNTVPFQNYAAWYIVAFGLLWLFYQLPFHKQNRLAGLILICQMAFFAAHNIAYFLE
jgi:bisanhydrobacterioruberin hydratase